MSRRSLRLSHTVNNTSDLHNDSVASNSSYYGNVSSVDRSSNRSVRQVLNSSRQSSSGSYHSTQRKSLSNSSFLSHSSVGSHVGDTSAMSSILDESLIREQTAVDHLWGLDDDDPKAGDTTVVQTNGELNSAQTQTTMINGYTCNDCSMLSDRNNVLTTFSASPATSTNQHTSSIVFSRNRSQKQQSRKAASGIFWWLGTGWYQLSTLISLLNVFLLTRCLPKMRKLLFLLIPLLLLLGLWFWGIGNLWSLLPAFTGLRTQSGKATEDTVTSFKPTPDIRAPISNKQETDFHIANQIKEMEKQLALLASQHSHQAKDHDKLVLQVQQIQEQVTKDSDQSQMFTLISSVVSEHLARSAAEKPEKYMDETGSIDADYKARILHLETLLGRLSEAVEEDRKRGHSSLSGGSNEDQDVLRQRIQSLEQEFATYKAELLKEKAARTSCKHADCVLQKVDAKVRESLQVMFASQENLPDSFKQWLSATYLSKADFNGILQELELRILKNISHHVSVTKHAPSAAVVEQAVTAGISGITKQEAHVIVSNALKLYSQDRTGMVDFALESGGGSVLGTRCSETFETKTALLSLFGIPLWYFSQSPRVVIQPDMYPGNCWAFKGAEGYLVIRLSMMIYPTSFSLEHIPKSLSPTGNITSAPKDFSVYGLDDEYQEEGTLLVQSVYDQDGEPLQIFQSTEENKKPFQIVELRVYSNWGHTDYTCVYRFRVHGTPAK